MLGPCPPRDLIVGLQWGLGPISVLEDLPLPGPNVQPVGRDHWVSLSICLRPARVILFAGWRGGRLGPPCVSGTQARQRHVCPCPVYRPVHPLGPCFTCLCSSFRKIGDTRVLSQSCQQRAANVWQMGTPQEARAPTQNHNLDPKEP